MSYSEVSRALSASSSLRCFATYPFTSVRMTSEIRSSRSSAIRTASRHVASSSRKFRWRMGSGTARDGSPTGPVSATSVMPPSLRRVAPNGYTFQLVIMGRTGIRLDPHEQMVGTTEGATMDGQSEPTATPIDDLATWLNAYREACTNRDQWTAIADRAKQQITQQLERNAAEVGTVGGRPAVRWTTVTSHRLDTKTLKAKDPELAERYTVTTTSQRFTVLDTDGAA